MMVKVCGVTSGDDVRVAVEAGAGALGFNFYPKSPRYLTLERAVELAAGVPAGVLRVGVFVNETAERIAEVVAAVPLDVAQLHGECGRPAGVRLWRAVAAGEGFDSAELDDEGVEAFLLDAPAGTRHGGTGRTFDWERVRGLKHRIVLAGGLWPDNVGDAIRAVRPWGVDACSRLESAPGKKDLRKVREFVQNALEVEI